MKNNLFMLDTDMASFLIKNHSGVMKKFRSINLSQICISAVTRAELQFGARQRPAALKLHAGLNSFLNAVVTLPWDSDAADLFGITLSDLRRDGNVIGDLDTMIASHAKSVHAVLVTNNTKHFKHVKGLTLENWVKP